MNLKHFCFNVLKLKTLLFSDLEVSYKDNDIHSLIAFIVFCYSCRACLSDTPLTCCSLSATQGLCDGWQPDMTALRSLEHRTLMLQVVTPPDADSGFMRLTARLESKHDQVLTSLGSSAVLWTNCG